MKESLIYTDDGDPLSTKPSFGGAEPQAQNSEEPDLTPADFEYVAEIMKLEVGMYPMDAPWSEPKDIWTAVLYDRKDSYCKANRLVHDYFEARYPYSDITIFTRILAEISPELTELAAKQFKDGDVGSRSWTETDGDASKLLKNKIDLILNDPENFDFLNKRNPSIKQGLELIVNVLLISNDPTYIYEKHSEYMRSCIDANVQGLPILYIPYESDFISPVEREDDLPKICEVSVSILYPMSKVDRERFDRQTGYTWDQLKGRERAHQINTKINIIAGSKVMGAGFETLDSTVGEAFVIKNGNSHEHGFFLAVNNLAKKSQYRRITSELTGLTDLNDEKIFIEVMELLYSMHEQGHRLYPEYGLFGEIPTDIPTVIQAIRIALDPTNLALAGGGKFSANAIVSGILTEYISEIINSVSDEAWFEGHKANPDNNLYIGYLLSGVIIVNALADSGIVRATDEGKIEIDLSSNNVAVLFQDLEKVESNFHDDPAHRNRASRRIKNAVANSEAIKIIELYRRKIDEIGSIEPSRVLRGLDSKVYSRN